MKRNILIIISIFIFIELAVIGVNIYLYLSKNIAEVAFLEDWDRVERMINNDADLNAKTEEGYTALMIACDYEKEEIVELLIEGGANVNEGTIGSYPPPPIIFAVTKGNIEITKLLIINGADVNKTNNSSLSPLMIAILRDYSELTELIYANIDDFNYTNEEELVIYSYIGDLDRVKELVLDKNTDPNVSIRGITPLCAAIKSENLEIIDILIDEGADPNAKCHYGESAKDYAKEKGIDLD